MRESLKLTEKTKLLEKCSTCGRQVGRLTDSPICGWMFSASRCLCSDQTEAVSIKSDNTRESPVVETEVELPLLPDSYEVLQFLGEGGMGQVFKVRDRSTGAVLAVKCLSRKLADDKDAVKRFHKEASAVSNLNHPHIISVYSHIETTDHRPCLLMDFIAGGSLKNRLDKNGKLNQDEAIDLFVQIAEALEYAHKNELLHRDLKPGNIMLSGTESGAFNAKLVDFGIAKVMPATSADRDTQDLTKTGEIFGSPAYMSPEQCMGFKLDERSDIYSFGCLMYETIAGQPPFNASNPIEVVVKQLSAQPRSWSNTPEDKPLKGLESLVFKCLAKESDERYQSVGELLKDLNLIKSGKKIKEFSREDKTKAVLSAGQAGLLLGESTLLLLYWTIISVPFGGILSVIPAVIVPVLAYQLIRQVKRYGLGGSSWKQWRFLSLVAYILLGITAIPVMVGSVGKSAALPEQFDQIYAVGLAIHLMVIPSAFATRIGAFIFTGAQRQFKTLAAQFAIVFIPLMVLVFASFGPGSSMFLPHLPAKVTANHRLSMTWRPKQAIATSRVAIALDPNFVEGYVILARNLIVEKKFEEALAVLERVRGKNLGFYSIEISKQRADAYVGIGQLDKAHEEADQAIVAQKKERYPAPYFLADLLRQRATINLQRHNYQSAVADFNEADDVYSSNYHIDDEKVAIAQWKNGNAKKAIETLTALIKGYGRSDPNYSTYNPEDFVERAIVYESIQDFDNARKDYLAATRGDPDAELTKQREPFNMERPWWVSIMLPASNALDDKNMKNRMATIRLSRAFAFHRLKDERHSLTELAKAEQLGKKKSDLLSDFVDYSGIKLDW